MKATAVEHDPWNGRYILAGHEPVPCFDLLTWAIWFEEHQAECRVDYSRLGPFTIGTYFLGLDFNLENMAANSGAYQLRLRPHLFETTISARPRPKEFGEAALHAQLGEQFGKIHGWQRRYATWDEAHAGHGYAYRLARKWLGRASLHYQKHGTPPHLQGKEWWR